MNDYSKTFCRGCGQEIHPQAEICPKCGVRNTSTFTSTLSGVITGSLANKTALPAVLLCFFLGYFGAHRFFAGKINSAIAMLILGIANLFLWWLVLPWVVLGIWWLVDLILIIMGKFTDSQGRVIPW
ncbi:MAG: NINE protein [Gammaproteobacteria bacterium]|nr:NINE protein [Gammaproteobacteria bacterium]